MSAAIFQAGGVDEVEVVDLTGLKPHGVTGYLEAAAESAAARTRLRGPDAERIASLWNQLPPGEQERCHIPPYALRFFSQGTLVAEASLCWECNNAFGQGGGGEFAYAFDASSPVAVELLARARDAATTAERVGSSGSGTVALGGWLILPMLGLISAALVNGEAAVFLVRPGSLSAELRTPLEQSVAALTAAASLALLFLMYQRSRWFPRLYIGYLLALVVARFIAVGAAAGAELIWAGFNEFTVRTLVGPVAMAAIGIPYMLRSQRVSNTFTR